MDWRARLDELASEHDLPAGAAERLAALLKLVRDDPAAPTTVTAPAQGVETHVADSLAALAVPELAEATTVADLGSGAGFPGLPLAVALPAAKVHLVESQRRKCAFLEQAVLATGTLNAVVAAARAEEWPERELDVVCVRAVAPLAVLVEYAAPLLRVGGVLIAWKGTPEAAEVAAGDAAAPLVGLGKARKVPVIGVGGADRHSLYVYSKVGLTPDRFPRRPGMARKRPLSG